jgi:hypothetical protein
VSAAVHVRGLRELDRSLGKVNRDAQKSVREGLKEAARPVVEAAKAKEGRWGGASIGTIGPRMVARGVFVTQRARKVTGLRGDFGALQMRQAFIPALEENEEEIVREVEHAIDVLLLGAGFGPGGL